MLLFEGKVVVRLHCAGDRRNIMGPRLDPVIYFPPLAYSVPTTMD